MKINFTMMTTYMSGGARAVFEIVNELSHRGHEVSITSLEGDHSWFSLKAEVTYVKVPYIIKILNPLNRLIRKEHFVYSSLGGILKWFKMGFDADLIKPLSEITPDCDINVATWFITSFAVHRSGEGVPFYLLMDFEEIVEPHGFYNVRMFKESLYLPLNIVTISNWLKEWVNENYSKEATVCGCGVNHEIFYPRQDVLTDISGPKIMAIFRGDNLGGKYKGNQDVIEALNIVGKKIPDITLVAVGDKNIFQKLITDNKINFSYKFFESPDDDLLAGLYSSADVFVFASHKEGFGLPPLEAMACETPVVTTDCFGVRDFVDDGKNAILVPIKDPFELAKGIKEILINKDLSDKLKANGLKTAQKFKWETVVDILEKAFIKSMKTSQRI